ncbi:hypothetical protein [Niabella hibiscisoli]|uniref:hypothetical protein n=1 Tax=Niabella hibiscisoli TaxID=1825928 RepID=UPI001F0F6EB4|nr:hypothetical protein [Niabella hibiscisoli]MCH5718155.1 hypothetical protein [Niabella hibiscisoli]
MQSGLTMHHDRNGYMKMIVSLLFCLAVTLSYGQKARIQNAHSSNPLGPESLLDTSNMYSSHYGSVARLTQYNMPCIMPYTSAVPIPNAARRETTANEIPNFWKSEPWKYRNQLRKSTPTPQSWNKTKDFKTPGVWNKDMLTVKPFPGIKDKVDFYMKRENQKEY